MSSTSTTQEPAAAPEGPLDDGQGFIEVHRRKRKYSGPRRESGAAYRRRRKERELSEREKDPSTSVQGTSRAPHRSGSSGARARHLQQCRGSDARTQGPEKGQPKRQRSATSSEPSLRKTKRAKQGTALGQRAGKSSTDPKSNAAYKDALLVHLKVAVINGLNPLGKLSEAEAEKIRMELTNKLVGQICGDIPGTNTPTPTFSSMVYVGQILKITCNDNSSLDWLKANVALLPPLEGVKLSVVKEVDLPSMSRVQIWLPTYDVDLKSQEDILRVLAGQNKHLDIANWCLFRHEKIDKSQGRLLVFGVAKKDAEWLKANGD
ncbi:uncharacterized protein [Onthophagus taurus]|uniref:uncharacterized protein n=1 Tax=Onthophagus taurus TaxID=166361 RepID=UPI0039BE7C85